ncbi:MAG: TonB-dependent receptor [Bacteroidota bacterium]
MRQEKLPFYKYGLLVLIFFSASLHAQELHKKKIQFSYQDRALDMVLFDLKINHRLNIQFAEEDVKNIRINKSIPKLPLEEAMHMLLQGTGLRCDLQPPKTLVISKLTEADLRPTNAPSTDQPTAFKFTISGVIKDSETGETLPFANLLVMNTTLGTTANVDGYFTLYDVPSDTVLLEISYIGYRSQYFRLQPGMDMEALTLHLSPAGQFLEEILVTSTKQEQMMKASKGISRIAISPAQLTAIPSLGEKDIFRSLQLLPGVSGSNESSSGLYVRGGTPDQNLVLFDGFTVYHVDHLFGFFSAFNSNAIKDVQLYKGGFESKYGGRLSSVVDITGKDGNAEEFNIGGGVSLMSLNAFTEIPFDGGKGTFILTGRRSFQSNFYNDLLEFSDGDSDTGTGGSEEEQPAGFGGRRGFATVEPNSWFYDLNGKATYRLGKNIFSLSYYNGKDFLDNSRYSDENGFGGGFPGGGATNFNFQIDVIDKSDWGNTGSSFKWSRRWNDQLYSNALVSYSNYFSFRDRGNQTIIERDTSTTEINNSTIEDNDLRDYSLKWDWEWQPSTMHKIGFGVAGNAFDIKYDFIQNDTTTVLARDDQGQLVAAYLQSKSTFWEKFIVLPGLRISYFDQTAQTYFEPRLQVQYLPTDNIKIKGATGRYYQFANRIIREDISQGSRDFWILSDGEQVPVGKADHFILGIAYETSDYLFDLEGYHKKLDNITEYSTRFVVNGFGPNSSLDFEENFFNGTGTANGLEVLAQKKTGKLTGWISYTLGRVENEFEVFGDEPFPAAHDVTNEVKVVGMYRVGNWSFGGTFIYATGRPYTAPIGAYSVELLDGNTTDHFAVSDKNALRLPDYHRFDVSANYNLNRFAGGKATVGLSLFNLYGRKNVWYKEYDVVDGVILETDVNLLGFTPSFYFNWSLQ